jgi:polyhydroxybutyrate depolymerase
VRPVCRVPAIVQVVVAAALLGVLVTTVAGCGGSGRDTTTHDPGVVVRTIRVAGTTRSYLVHLPANRPTSEGSPIPVVLSFHGAAQDAERQRRLSRLDATADRYGFVVVYPQGTRDLLGGGRAWNAGTCCARAARVRSPDVAFTSQLLDDLRHVVDVDPRRVFATGMSNGAMMAYRLGCELAGRIAAVAAVSGALMVSPCRPARPVSVLAVHGTADRIVPAGGGVGRPRYLGTLPSVEESVAPFLAADQCPVPARPRAAVQADARVTTYAGCRDGTAVETVLVEGGGHTWPGGAAFPAGGTTSTRTDANELIWRFFARHAMPAGTSAAPSSP